MLQEPSYHALHIWSWVYVWVQNWKLPEIFSRMLKSRPKKIVIILRILENVISSGKNKQTNKKATRVCLKVYRKTHENTWITKIRRPARKKTSIVYSFSRSHSPIDNCSLFIRHKEYKSQATSHKYRLICSHSLQQSKLLYSFFSRSAKPAGGFKQLHNKLCMSLWMATEGIVFLHFSHFSSCTKTPHSQ